MTPLPKRNSRASRRAMASLELYSSGSRMIKADAGAISRRRRKSSAITRLWHVSVHRGAAVNDLRKAVLQHGLKANSSLNTPVGLC